MVEGIPQLQSALNFLLNEMFIRYSSLIYEMFHPFQGFIIHLDILMLSCILICKHDHVLSFISVYF
jgi:hypothetical protein